MKHKLNSAPYCILHGTSVSSISYGSEGFTRAPQRSHTHQQRPFSLHYCPYSAKLTSSACRGRRDLWGHIRLIISGLPHTLLCHLAHSGLSNRERLVPGGRVSGGVRKSLLPTLTASTRYSGGGRPQHWHSPTRICEGRNASRQALYPSLQAEMEGASVGSST